MCLRLLRKLNVNINFKGLKMTAEILDAVKTKIAAYQPFYAQLAELEKNNSSIAFDYESPKGNKEARSHIFKLRQSKAALEKTRKDEKSESLRTGKAIDSEADEIEKRIEAMIQVHQAKIDEIEQREKDRIAKIQARLSALREVYHEKSAADYRYHLNTLEAVEINDSWAEFVAEASIAKDQAINKHRQLLADRELADAQAAELEKLRKEAAERAQKEHDDAIAKAAAEKAIVDAEAKARQEREEAELAIARAEAKAKAEAEAAERRELQLKLEAEQDKKDALAKAHSDAERAVQAEKDRVAAVAKAEAEDAARREKNQAHKRSVNNVAMKAFVAGGIDEETAKAVIKLIATGSVPNISISY